MSEPELELLAQAARETTADTGDTETHEPIIEFDDFRDFSEQSR